MASRSHRRTSADTSPPVFEEKITKVTGESSVRRYTKGKFLGKGGFARVYEATNMDTGKKYAAKVVAKSSLTKARAKQKLMSEIKIHRSLRHENIVAFEHFFEDSENVYILLEICDNQTTSELIKRRKRLYEIEVQCYMYQLIKALKYLHAHRVIHRDLKLGNFFLNEKMQIKVGDFGLAAKLEFEGERKRTICGTPNYIAPEVLDGKHGHSYQVDIWSLGVVFYTMLIGKPPFETSDVKTTYRRIRMNAYTFPENVQISETAKQLVTQILASDPAKRPSLDEILSHDFFHNGGTIPKLLPVATMACPPSQAYIKQFQPNSDKGDSRLAVSQRSIDPNSTPASLRHGGSMFSGAKSERNLQRLPSNPIQTQTLQSSADRPRGEPKSLTSTQTLKSSQSNWSVSPTPNVQPNQGEIWVNKWVDYSSKYGLGYLLTNGQTGVFFNDATKMVLDRSGAQFYYMEKQVKNEHQDSVSTYQMNEHPKDLAKKVTLLQHFKSYLEGEIKANVREDEEKRTTPIYVKKWMRTKHAIMFRLSNKIVQVNFQDSTEIILSSETRTVTYVNKRGERSQYQLTSALESSNTEMTKRLKYTKEILTQMLSHGSGSARPMTNRRATMQN